MFQHGWDARFQGRRKQLGFHPYLKGSRCQFWLKPFEDLQKDWQGLKGNLWWTYPHCWWRYRPWNLLSCLQHLYSSHRPIPLHSENREECAGIHAPLRKIRLKQRREDSHKLVRGYHRQRYQLWHHQIHPCEEFHSSTNLYQRRRPSSLWAKIWCDSDLQEQWQRQQPDILFWYQNIKEPQPGLVQEGRQEPRIDWHWRQEPLDEIHLPSHQDPHGRSTQGDRNQQGDRSY